MPPPLAATPARGSPWRWPVAAAAALFGAATIVQGGSVVLGLGGAREAAGAYVPFVVAFNFGAGFLYVAAAAALAARRPWAPGLALFLAVATLAVFAALGVLVARGGAYEPRTVAAMTLRSLFWVAVALVAPRLVRARTGAAP